MSLQIQAPPTLEPVSLAEAKQHLRLDHDEEDALIDSLLLTSRRLIEESTWLQLLTAEWEWKLDQFPSDVLFTPRGPLRSATIEYVDGAGATQTLDPAQYVVDPASQPGRIYPAYGVCWPATRCQRDAVMIALTSGYGDEPEDVPQPLRTAILMLTGHLYENRGLCGGPIPEYIDWLIAPYRMTYARATVTA